MSLLVPSCYTYSVGLDPAKKVRVMLADANEAVVAAVKAILEEDSRIEVVASAATGADALRKATVARPLVLITDLRFPDMPAPQVIAQLSASGLELAVLVLSVQATKGNSSLEAALKAGAFEFVKRPPNYKDLDQIGRQIRTHVMVAAVTKSKQLGQRVDPSAASAGRAAALGLASRKVDLLYVECEEPLVELPALFAGLKTKLKASVLARVRADAAGAAMLAQALSSVIPAQVYVGNRGDYVVAGRVCLLPDQDEDVVVERTLSGFIELKTAPLAAGHHADKPNAGVLLPTLAALFGASLTAALIGAPREASLLALGLLAKPGALALTTQETANPPAGVVVVPAAALTDLLAR